MYGALQYPFFKNFKTHKCAFAGPVPRLKGSLQMAKPNFALVVFLNVCLLSWLYCELAKIGAMGGPVSTTCLDRLRLKNQRSGLEL